MTSTHTSTSSATAHPASKLPTGHPIDADHASNIADPHAVTISGLILEESYGPSTPGSIPHALQNIETEIPEPGAFPYTRGLFPQGYRSRLWTMRQFAGFGSAQDTNTRFKYLLETAKTSKTKANTGLSTAFDLPTLMGRDSDDPLSAGEVGKCGVAIDTIEDMHILYNEIPIDSVTVSQTINGPACCIWAMYIAMAMQRNIPIAALGGTLQNDILKEFHSQNEFIYPPEPSVKLVVDTIEFQSEFMPKWNSVSISGYHIREAGSTAPQELAFTLRDGMEYVEACLERGMDINSFGPRLSFFFNAHNEFFEEICKLRAARRIWARAMKHRYGATNPKAWYMKTHVQTAGCSLTEQQPYNNIVRVAYQAMAGVLGGCQSLHTDSMDETLGLPTEQAVTIALRTQQILAHETGVTRVTDPLGGSWFIESLTDQMESEALNLIQEIDHMGAGGTVLGGTGLRPVSSSSSPSSYTTPVGRASRPSPTSPQSSSSPNPPSAGLHQAYEPRPTYTRGVVNGINKGYFRRSIAEASYRFSEEMEAHDRIIVGVNEYVDANEKRQVEILEISHQVELDQNNRLAKFKANRDQSQVTAALDAIRATCQAKPEPERTNLLTRAGAPAEILSMLPKVHQTNIMPPLITAALAGATLGEMVQAMADIYGRYAGGPEW
ncbi:MAG: acyl-CoA mutase large subunit family protein [Phycisphaerales bacterium]